MMRCTGSAKIAAMSAWCSATILRSVLRSLYGQTSMVDTVASGCPDESAAPCG
ncbi:MAG: hypothetical protein GY815_06515 [Gammaproteobacteria bacterium]|nr:hypothetical protein [Gammaproteobacteria bacterium]